MIVRLLEVFDKDNKTYNIWLDRDGTAQVLAYQCDIDAHDLGMSELVHEFNQAFAKMWH